MDTSPSQRTPVSYTIVDGKATAKVVFLRLDWERLTSRGASITNRIRCGARAEDSSAVP